MEGMTISEYAAVKELENENGKGWGATTALWVLVAAIIVFAIVYNWTKSCNEKVQFATGLANLNGRINCLEPDVRWAGQQLYAANGVIAATVQGVKGLKECFGDQLYNLNQEVFFDNGCCDNNGRRGRRGCNDGCCGGNREFAQHQNYTLASQNVTVTERCCN